MSHGPVANPVRQRPARESALDAARAQAPALLRAPGAKRRTCCAVFALVLAALLGASERARADREVCLAAHEEGQLLRVRGQHRAARDKFVACAKKSCPKLVSQDCAALLAELEPRLPTVVFEVSAEDGTKLVDARVFANDELVSERTDGRAVTLDPGDYRVRVEAPGRPAFERELAVREGEKARLVRLQLGRALETAVAAETPAEPDRPDRFAEAARAHPVPVATYVLGGSALAVLGTGIALGVLGKQELDRLRNIHEEDGERFSEQDAKKGRNMYIAADVAFGVAGGLAVAATWLYVARHLERKREAGSRRMRLDAQLDRSGAGLGVLAAF